MRRVLPICLLLASVACTRNLDMNAVNAAISKGVKEQTTLDVSAVTCPDMREIKQGDTFTCAVKPTMGGALEVTVTQENADGGINWKVTKTDGLLDLSIVEQSVVGGLKEQLSVDATVSCGGAKYRATEPGKTFDCTAKVASGEQAPVTVTMQDADGNIGWAMNAKQ
jgi:hypothetical protein